MGEKYTTQYSQEGEAKGERERAREGMRQRGERWWEATRFKNDNGNFCQLLKRLISRSVRKMLLQIFVGIIKN